MKALVLMLGLMGTQSYAMEMPSMQFPTESGWAIGMIEMACDVNLSSSVTGVILEDGPVVVYEAYDRRGNLVAAAEASDTGILAKKNCLVRP
jgi:hypothetical protein